jgi:hypothetical protein
MGEILHLYYCFQKISKKSKGKIKIRELIKGKEKKMILFVGLFDVDKDSQLEFKDFLKLMGVATRSTIQKRLECKKKNFRYFFSIINFFFCFFIKKKRFIQSNCWKSRNYFRRRVEKEKVFQKRRTRPNICDCSKMYKRSICFELLQNQLDPQIL